MSAPVWITNARLLDPATDYDGQGALHIADGRITAVHKGAGFMPTDAHEVVDAGGLCLSPGLIDIRVKTGEPGAEPKETLKSARADIYLSKCPQVVGKHVVDGFRQCDKSVHK